MTGKAETMQNALEQMSSASDGKEFREAIEALKEFVEDPFEMAKRAYYPVNEYSEKDTKEKMEEAKKRVMEYLEQIGEDKMEKRYLLRILENFYLFLENLLERKPHGRAGIREEQLAYLKIRNEYDVQHLLYAYLKPMFPMARAEVSEDTGYGTVRTDIYLNIDQVIEIKYTRATMKLKKLIEEIEADMVHYSAKTIYFFIYDQAKIIENPQGFKKAYEEKVKEKQIYIVIHQPKYL